MDLQQQITRVAHDIDPNVMKLLVDKIQGNHDFIIWGLGLCAGGFGILLGLTIKSIKDIEKRVTYSWIEDEIADTQKLLKEIKDSLIGGFEHKGLITRQNQLEEKVNTIESTIKK